jgi:hypothetical protein
MRAAVVVLTTVSVSSSSSGGRTAPSGFASAGLGRRFAASAIDWVLCGVPLLLVTVIVAAPIEAAARDDFGNVSNDVLWKVARSIVAVPVLLYFGLFLRTGHTLGMRALDLYVRVASKGRAPGLARSAPPSVLGRPLRRRGLRRVVRPFHGAARPVGPVQALPLAARTRHGGYRRVDHCGRRPRQALELGRPERPQFVGPPVGTCFRRAGRAFGRREGF